MRIIIAGGGTGGHLFPAIALAEEFESRGKDNEILFVGTKKGIEYRILPTKGFKLKTILVSGVTGGSPLQRVIGVLKFLLGFFQSLGIIYSFRPNLVLGTGGYVSAPVILAAWLFRINTAICEQNSIPGLTNRILGRLVKKVFIAFEESAPYFPPQKTYCTGNPIRKEFLSFALPARKQNQSFTLLILGGSQGARSINHNMINSLDYLSSLRNKIKIIHQTGASDFSWVKKEYEKKGFKAEVVSFISDIAPVYQEADLVISRAGAITITEILASGKPSILIPYPYAAYNHQEVNAQILVNKGAARMIRDPELTGAVLGDLLLYLINHPEELTKMQEKAQALGRPEATHRVVDHYFPDNRTTLKKGGNCHL